MDGPIYALGNRGAYRLIQQGVPMQFIPAHWLEFAAWNRGLIVYSREIPDPEPRAVCVSQKPENCKVPLLSRIRPAA